MPASRRVFNAVMVSALQKICSHLARPPRVLSVDPKIFPNFSISTHFFMLGTEEDTKDPLRQQLFLLDPVFFSYCTLLFPKLAQCDFQSSLPTAWGESPASPLSACVLLVKMQGCTPRRKLACFPSDAKEGLCLLRDDRPGQYSW